MTWLLFAEIAGQSELLLEGLSLWRCLFYAEALELLSPSLEVIYCEDASYGS